MTLNKLSSEIAKREGKKVSVSVGNIREILGILSDMLVGETPGASLEIYGALLLAGDKRAKKAKKK